MILYSNGLSALSKSALSNLHWAVLMIPPQREFCEMFRCLSDICWHLQHQKIRFCKFQHLQQLRRLELAQKLRAAIAPVFSRQQVIRVSSKVSDRRSSLILTLADRLLTLARSHMPKCNIFIDVTAKRKTCYWWHRLELQLEPAQSTILFHFLKHVSVVWTPFELISST